MVNAAELTEEIVDVSIVEEARESIVKLADIFERCGAEVARDCKIEVVDCVNITEEAAMIVKFTVVAILAFTEDDVTTALVETVAIEGGTTVVLAERLSALIMSAAFAGVLDPCSTK